MDRNLALNLARVCEAAAISSSRFLGKGDKNGADGAAVDAMRRMFDTVEIDGVVVIGEGEIDEAPMLYIGEHIGKNSDKEYEKVDIAVDPLDGKCHFRSCSSTTRMSVKCTGRLHGQNCLRAKGKGLYKFGRLSHGKH